MSKGLPWDEFLGEPLHGVLVSPRRLCGEREAWATDTGDYLQITGSISPQHLDCDFAPLVYALPYIPESTTVH